MKDAEGKILYIGKSKRLRARLGSYFHQRHKVRRLQQLVSEVADIEIMLVNNEDESLLLENNLIKLHKPPYNRALRRENSGYAYLHLTEERYPRLGVHYRKRNRIGGVAGVAAKAGSSGAADAERAERAVGAAKALSTETAGASRTGRAMGASTSIAAPSSEPPVRRLGPFKSRQFRTALMEFLIAHYGLRTCDPMPKRVCLLYHLGRCSGVCEGMISEEEYRGRVNEAAELLSNRGEELIRVMKAKMEEHAERLEFEQAGSLLEHIRILERKPAKQIVDREGTLSQEVVYFGSSGVLIAAVQEGMLREMRLLPWKGSGAAEASNGPVQDESCEAGVVKSAAERAGTECDVESSGVADEAPIGYGSDADASGDTGEKESLAAYDRFLASYYLERETLPDEIIVSSVSNIRMVRAALRRSRGYAPRIVHPKRGLKLALLQLCASNYEYRVGRLEAATAAAAAQTEKTT